MKRPVGSHPVYWRTIKAAPPPEWEIRPVAEYATVVKGRLPKTLLDKPTEGSVRYLLIDGLSNGGSLYTEDTGLPMISEDDTAVVADGARSGLPIRGVAGALGSTLLRFSAREGFDKDFLHCVLESLYPYTNSATIGGAIPHLDKRLLATSLLATPPADERTQIGRILRAADAAITSAGAELKTAHDVKKSFTQQFFTRGIPGRHAQFREIKYGMIPTSWELSPLKTMATVDSGVTLNQDRTPRRNAYRYLTVVNVQREHISLDEERYLELWDTEVPWRLLQEKDLLIVEGHANAGEIGRTAMVDTQTAGMTFQNHLFRVRVAVDDVLPEFLLYALNSERVRRRWNAVCNTSSGLNTINRRQLRNLPIAKPCRKEQQEEIVGLLRSATARINAVEGTIAVMRYLKKSLLQNLLTGRVRATPGVST